MKESQARFQNCFVINIWRITVTWVTRVAQNDQHLPSHSNASNASGAEWSTSHDSGDDRHRKMESIPSFSFFFFFFWEKKKVGVNFFLRGKMKQNNMYHSAPLALLTLLLLFQCRSFCATRVTRCGSRRHSLHVWIGLIVNLQMWILLTVTHCYCDSSNVDPTHCVSLDIYRSISPSLTTSEESQ